MKQLFLSSLAMWISTFFKSCMIVTCSIQFLYFSKIDELPMDTEECVICQQKTKEKLSKVGK